MRPWLAIALAVLTSSTFAPAAARAQDRTADTAAVTTLVARYVEVREQRDPAALARLLAADADQLVSSGEWRRGRAAVVSGGLASSARNSGARTIEVETVRFLATDVALADGRYEIAGTAGTPPRRMWTAFVMVRREGEWRISAIRNMRPAE